MGRESPLLPQGAHGYVRRVPPMSLLLTSGGSLRAKTSIPLSPEGKVGSLLFSTPGLASEESPPRQPFTRDRCVWVGVCPVLPQALGTPPSANLRSHSADQGSPLPQTLGAEVRKHVSCSPGLGGQPGRRPTATRSLSVLGSKVLSSQPASPPDSNRTWGPALCCPESIPSDHLPPQP